MSRKQAILQSAADLFLGRGYLETCMIGIAKPAGVADAMPFYIFRSKEEQYPAVLEKFRTSIKHALDDDPGTKRFTTGVEMVEGLVGFYIDLADKIADRFPLLHRYDPYRMARNDMPFRKHLLIRVCGRMPASGAI